MPLDEMGFDTNFTQWDVSFFLNAPVRQYSFQGMPKSEFIGHQ